MIDHLEGGYGDDSLDGGSGNDWLTPGIGNDIFTGGEGTDTLDVNYSGQTGPLLINQPGGTGLQIDNTIEIAKIIGTSANDRIDASNVTSVVRLQGDDGNDYLVGSSGNDAWDIGPFTAGLYGGNGNDTLQGVNSNSLNPGQNEQDYLSGGTGADLFILGTANWVAYDDKNTSNAGTSNYADIADFNPSEGDKAQLHNAAGDYRLAISGANTNLYIDKPGSEPDELIAIFRNITTLDLDSNAFQYIPPIQLNPGLLAFSQATYSINEDGTTTTAVRILRSQGSDGAVSVTLNLSGGTATYPNDYTTNTFTVNFADGETAQTVTIPIVNDTQNEANETINLTLSDATGGATIGTQNTATLTIIDDDAVPVPGTLAFSQATYSVNEDGTPVQQVTITRTGGSDGAVGVTLTPSNGTATAPDDYNNSPILVNFANGQTSKTVTIPIVNDTQNEPNETVNLTLSNPTGGATIGTQNTATLTIIDDDIVTPNLPTVTLTLNPVSVSENGSPNLIYTFTRNGDTTSPLTINFGVSGTAQFSTSTKSGDYTRTGTTPFNASNGSITIPAGATNAKLTLNPNADTVVEDPETISLTLTASPNYTIGTVNPLTGTITNDDGDAEDNLLVGGTSTDILDGKAGNDTMIGGLGNDTYFVDSIGDVIQENPNAGTDTVNINRSFDLAGTNFENVTLLGTDDLNATGTNANNTLNGNSGNNTLIGLGGNDKLDGKAGNDTMEGGAGNDSYVVDSIDDVVTELPNEGTDSLTINRDFDLTGTNLENLTLTGTGAFSATGTDGNNTLNGNSGNNTLTGLGGNDKLDGKAGSDTMEGGLGNDSYVVDNAGDVVTELPGEGTDSLTINRTFDLTGTNIENLTLTGTGAFSATGTDVNNTLTGNSGNNTLTGLGGNDILDGKAGSDTMEGGEGNDTYTIDHVGDTITELADEGTDTVKVGFAYSLEDTNLENLTLTGSKAINGTGNDSANILTGNGAANTLTGLDGNDSLVGGSGNDILVGGSGNDTLTGSAGLDTFVFNSVAEGIDRITDFKPIDDTIAFGSGGVLGVNFLYNSTSGALSFDADGVGGNSPIQLAILPTKLTLTQADFVAI